MKKIITLSIVLLLALLGVAAEEIFFSANDLDVATYTSPVTIDGFTLNGNESKAIDVQEMDERTAEDGEIFNNRIKLNGTGKKDMLSITFNAKKGQTVRVYLNSSSKTDERVLNLFTPTDATPIATIPAPPATSDMTVGTGEFKIEKDGTYTIGSAKSGIYIYAIVIE
jgi:hypothetical protein